MPWERGLRSASLVLSPLATMSLFVLRQKNIWARPKNLPRPDPRVPTQSLLSVLTVFRGCLPHLQLRLVAPLGSMDLRRCLRNVKLGRNPFALHSVSRYSVFLAGS